MIGQHASNHRAVEAYVDDQLSHSARLTMAAHLLMCPGCKRHAATIRAIKQALRSRADQVGNAWHMPPIGARVPRTSMTRTLLTGAVGGTAAGVVLATMTAWLMISNGVSLLAPLRAAATIVLSDGTPASPIIGGAVHVVLAATYGALFALVIRKGGVSGGPTMIAAGLGYGLLLFTVNFLVLANLFFGAFAAFNQPFQALTHALYGTVVAIWLILRH